MSKIRILSIDAWGNRKDGYEWNQWFTEGELDTKEVNINNTRALLKYLRSEGYLASNSQGKVYIDDDQYNLVICDKSNGCPLYAIEYGADA